MTCVLPVFAHVHLIEAAQKEPRPHADVLADIQKLPVDDYEKLVEAHGGPFLVEWSEKGIFSPGSYSFGG